MGLYFAVLVVLMFALVLLAPPFGFFAFAGYLEAFRVLRGRWLGVGVAAIAITTATSQNGGLPEARRRRS